MDEQPREYKQRLYDTPSYQRYKKEKAESEGEREDGAALAAAGAAEERVDRSNGGEEAGVPAERSAAADVAFVDKLDEPQRAQCAEAVADAGGPPAAEPASDTVGADTVGIPAADAPRRRGRKPGPQPSARGKRKGVKRKQTAPSGAGILLIHAAAQQPDLAEEMRAMKVADSRAFHKWGKVVGFVMEELKCAPAPERAAPGRRGRKPAAKLSDASPSKRDFVARTAPGGSARARSIFEAANDPRCLHFLAKICGVGKSAAEAFIKEQQKKLALRNRANRADVPGRAVYAGRIEGGCATIETQPGDATLPARTTQLRVLDRIEAVEAPRPCSLEMEYAIYKCRGNFERLAAAIECSYEDAILLHYLFVHRATEPSSALIRLIAHRDWLNKAEKLVFKSNYKKYGSNLNLYNMNRTVDELRVYLRYFLGSSIGARWSNAERLSFATAFVALGRDWEGIAKTIPTKTPSDVRLYYKNYYEQLSAENKLEELMLPHDGVDSASANSSNITDG
ncbi:hypothetical protein PAPHI01_2366 [Pancytospora philotis]|nr:hypothetical protein PAPHI01_2366 [Pancytospora philotis]